MKKYIIPIVEETPIDPLSFLCGSVGNDIENRGGTAGGDWVPARKIYV